MDAIENAFAQFVVEKLENAGGSMKFQHITGHLSQLDDRVRKAVGTKPTEIIRFIRNRPELFKYDGSSLVSLVKSDSNSSFHNSSSNFDRNDCSSNSDGGFPKYLKEHDGIVIKVLPTFGFIASKKPKASVYFIASNFENGDKYLLTDLVEPGQKVCFNARIGNPKFESKYQATKVWLPEKVENEVIHPDGFKKVRKTRDSGKYDGNVSEGSGKVQKLFDTFGFIIINNDPQNTVYFTKKNVCNVENILDLNKVMKVHDEVEYKAVRSTNHRARWQASKVWLRGKSKNNESGKRGKEGSCSRERKSSEPGKIYPSGNGAIIKFGLKFEYLADADSCHFYMHGIQVKDVCWEFSDGDSVTFDAIKIKSAPGWKALLCWVGKRPDIVLPVDLGDFSEFPDEDMDDVNDAASITSKLSGTSTLSETSHNSSGTSKNARSYSSSKVQKSRDTHSPSNHRNSRGSNKSNFQNTSSRSLSRSSTSSQHSNQNFQKKRSHNAYERSRDESSSKLTNSPQSGSRFENDSGFGSCKSVPREPRSSNYEKDIRPSHGNNFKDDYEEYEDTSKYAKPMIKSDKSKNKTYTNWGDSPYPDEENVSDPDKEDMLSETSKNHSDDEKSSHSKCDSDEKYEEPLSNEEFDDADYENAVEIIENDSLSVDNKENIEDAASENKIKGILEETSKDDEEDDASVSEEPQIQPYIKRFSDLSGKVLKVYCKYAEIENEHIKKRASFFWTDLYCNGRPAPDHFDDLKEVLREGQTVNFNCIEIVDDSGSCWHKITMAWKGTKPRIQEMTPDEFIFENSLVVSASEDLNEITDSSQAEAEQQKSAAPTRKFLTLAIEDDDNEDDDEEDSTHLSSEITEASTAKTTPVHNRQVFNSSDLVPLPESSLQDTSSPVNLVQLTEAVGKMFLSYRHSEIAVDVIASDIVNLVLSQAGVKNVATSVDVCNSCEKESQTETVAPSADLEHCSISHKADLTESSVQTIITGDVIAQSIFTL